jgi:hypothetical protein
MSFFLRGNSFLKQKQNKYTVKYHSEGNKIFNQISVRTCQLHFQHFHLHEEVSKRCRKSPNSGLKIIMNTVDNKVGQRSNLYHKKSLSPF